MRRPSRQGLLSYWCHLAWHSNNSNNLSTRAALLPEPQSLHVHLRGFACHDVVTDDEGYKKVFTNHYFKDGAEGYKQAMFLSFKRGVSKLVADYTELSERVRKGEFTRDDFISIVQAYNQYKNSQAQSKP